MAFKFLAPKSLETQLHEQGFYERSSSKTGEFYTEEGLLNAIKALTGSARDLLKIKDDQLVYPEFYIFPECERGDDGKSKIKGYYLFLRPNEISGGKSRVFRRG